MGSFSHSIKGLLLMLGVFVLHQVGIGQKQAIDSLENEFTKAKHDTLKCQLLLKIYTYSHDFKSAVKVNERLETICNDNLKTEKSAKLRKFYNNALANAYNNLGIAHRRNGDNQKALEYYDRTLKIMSLSDDRKDMSMVYCNMAVIHTNQGQLSKSLELLGKAREIAMQSKYKKGEAYVYNLYGSVLRDQGDLTSALQNFKQSLSIYEELKDRKGVGDLYNNIGGIYLRLKKHDSAGTFYRKALDISLEFNNPRTIGLAYNNIGIIYYNQGIDSIAERYMNTSLSYYEKSTEKSAVATILHNLANIQARKGDTARALELHERSLKMAQEIGSPSGIMNASNALKGLYLSKGLYKQAYKMYELQITMRDSINSKENRNAVLKTQLKYEYEKKEVLAKAELDKQRILLDKNKQSLVILEKENELKELSLSRSQMELRQREIENENSRKEVELLNKDKELKETEARKKEEDLKKQRIMIYGFATGSVLVLVLLAFVLKGYLQKKKDNQTIQQQKALVEAKQKEIIDSINYAKRLQQAILPPESYWHSNLPESFVLYRPKDIVAGDFYWMEQKDDLLFFAAADCTGHGVPGAMVSVVCSNALNRSIHEFGITDPGKILDKTRELVIATFEKSDMDVRDGMDISLCCLNKNTRHLQWAGANNSLLYIQNKELKQIKADKQPIGKHIRMLPFTTHHISLNKGDQLYLYTDGYADQFGGLKGKKLKYKQLTEMLIENAGLSSEFQKTSMDRTLNNWMGVHEQVDDICIIGVRV